MLLERIHCVLSDVAAAPGLANCTAIDVRNVAGGMVYVQSGAGLTTLTWYACDTTDGTYLPARDGAGGAVTATIAAGQACPIPAALFGAAFLKAVGNAAAVLSVSLKA